VGSAISRAEARTPMNRSALASLAALDGVRTRIRGEGQAEGWEDDGAWAGTLGEVVTAGGGTAASRAPGPRPDGDPRRRGIAHGARARPGRPPPAAPRAPPADSPARAWCPRTRRPAP